MMRIGFIGLGVMGRPMALHLLRGGFELGVYARHPDAAKPLVDAGATAHATAAALACVSDVVITMVSGTSDVEEVLLGPGGVADAAHAGTVVIDMSTISPAATRHMADLLATRGIQMLDAPVSGGPAGAEQATLTIMVGGEHAVLERVRPILDCLGKTIVHMGAHGAGQTTKACNQLTLVIAAEGVAEALALAGRCGLDPRRVREALLGGLAASRVLDVFGARMADRQFQSGIATRLYHKDLHIVLDTARDAGQALPAASIVMEHIDELMARDQGDRDLSTLMAVVERLPSRDH